MVKIILVIVFVTLVFAIAAFFYSIPKTAKNNSPLDLKTIRYKLNSKNYTLLVADTPQKWERGLMYLRKLDGVDGMIFIFPDVKYRTFWNKNTLMDLKLLWIRNNSLIGESDLESIEKTKQISIVNSPEPADKVIEIPQ